MAKDLSALHSGFRQIFTDLSDFSSSRKVDSENNSHLGRCVRRLGQNSMGGWKDNVPAEKFVTERRKTFPNEESNKTATQSIPIDHCSAD